MSQVSNSDKHTLTFGCSMHHNNKNNIQNYVYNQIVYILHFWQQSGVFSHPCNPFRLVIQH